MSLWAEKWTDRDVEAYAHGLYDVMLALGVLDGHHKSYDPLTIERSTHRAVAHSYVFDLWDGGRHHEWDGNLDTLVRALTEETAQNIRHWVEDNRPPAESSSAPMQPRTDLERKPEEARLKVGDVLVTRPLWTTDKP